MMTPPPKRERVVQLFTSDGARVAVDVATKVSVMIDQNGRVSAARFGATNLRLLIDALERAHAQLEADAPRGPVFRHAPSFRKRVAP